MMDSSHRALKPKKHPITDDFSISGTVLGLGINGKVVECFSKTTGDKFALKVGMDGGFCTCACTGFHALMQA
jgi:uncharacterized protein YcfJ